jgi:hypothetical protein
LHESLSAAAILGAALMLAAVGSFYVAPAGRDAVERLGEFTEPPP